MTEHYRKLILSIDDDLPDPQFGSFYRHSSSNVWRFHNAILRDSEDQRTMFVPGRALKSSCRYLSHAVSHWDRCQEAFATLVLNYRKGDEIFIVGGGSGAAVALEVAALLDSCGIPEEMSYLCDEDGRIIAIESPPCMKKGQQRNLNSTRVSIRFLGLWDTVARQVVPASIAGSGAIDIPLTEIADLPPIVEEAHHLLALDDHREVFAPHLLEASGKLKEVWFIGMHEAVLGVGRERAVSDIPLRYMVQAAQGVGVIFHETTMEDVFVNPGHLGVVSCEVQGLLGRQIREVYVREGGSKSSKKPLIHKSVFNRIEARMDYRPPNVDQLAGSYIVIEE